MRKRFRPLKSPPIAERSERKAWPRVPLTASLPTVSSALPVLGLQEGDTAFFREVRLVGSDTGCCYAQASSLLNPSRIHPKLFQELINEEVGLGEVLRNAARGSFREVLDITRLSPEAICRTYAVFVDQLPAILITESFGVEVFQAP